MKRLAESELARVAFMKGASMDLNGRILNANREQHNVLPASSLPPPPPAAPPPAPTINTTGLERAAQASAQTTENLAALVGALVGEMRSQRGTSPQPVTAWKFSIERDHTGITGITATAIRGKA